MKKPGINTHFQQFQCTWESIQIWGLVSDNKFIHLSFDLKRHDHLCATVETTPLSTIDQERFCTNLIALREPAIIPFPEYSLFIQKGTSFQKRVWRALSRIPFAETRTYGDIAKEIGNPKLARAVGQACNKNPLPLIIPCHRVVSATGLGGFAGGSEVKKALLDYEQHFSKS